MPSWQLLGLSSISATDCFCPCDTMHCCASLSMLRHLCKVLRAKLLYEYVAKSFGGFGCSIILGVQALSADDVQAAGSEAAV